MGRTPMIDAQLVRDGWSWGDVDEREQEGRVEEASARNSDSISSECGSLDTTAGTSPDMPVARHNPCIEARRGLAGYGVSTTRVHLDV